MKKSYLIILGLLVLSLSLSAVDFPGIEAKMGMISYGTTSNNYTATPLRESLGAAFPITLSERWELRPELTFFYFNYVYDESDGRAVPAAIETANRISVFHFLLNPAISYVIPLADTTSLGFSFSPSILLRLPMIAADDGEEDRESMTSYFYSTGRFFYPSLGGFFRWQFAEETALNLSAWGRIPVFHLWDNSTEPFWDQFIISADVGFIFSF